MADTDSKDLTTEEIQDIEATADVPVAAVEQASPDDAPGVVLNRAILESQLEVNAGIHRLLGILVIGGVLYTSYFARELLLPILLAGFFSLLLSPLMKRLCNSWLPRWVAALLLIAISMATLAGIGNALYAPAAEWVGRAPQVVRSVTPKLKSLMRPINEANKVGESISAIASDGGKNGQQVVVQAPDRPSLLSTTPRVLASALAVVLLTYFFLLYGDSLLRRTPPEAVANITSSVSQLASSSGSGMIVVMRSPASIGSMLTSALPRAFGAESGRRQTFSL